MKRVRYFAPLLLVALALAALAGCSSGSTTSGDGVLTVDKAGDTSINLPALKSSINLEAVLPLEEVEQEGITYMREEEKLARDVYAKLYEDWGVKTFNNIGSSEQTHMDAVKTLVDRYSLADPAAGKAMGEFADQNLQQLYDTLVEQGGKSQIDALKVGAAIEEIDILDLKDYLSQTSKRDIIVVYENLLKGSRNHLRAFVSALEKRKVDYQPQYLTPEQYNEIISAPIERGR